MVEYECEFRSCEFQLLRECLVDSHLLCARGILLGLLLGFLGFVRDYGIQLGILLGFNVLASGLASRELFPFAAACCFAGRPCANGI